MDPFGTWRSLKKYICFPLAVVLIGGIQLGSAAARANTAREIAAEIQPILNDKQNYITLDESAGVREGMIALRPEAENTLRTIAKKYIDKQGWNDSQGVAAGLDALFLPAGKVLEPGEYDELILSYYVTAFYIDEHRKAVGKNDPMFRRATEMLAGSILLDPRLLPVPQIIFDGSDSPFIDAVLHLNFENKTEPGVGSSYMLRSIGPPLFRKFAERYLSGSEHSSEITFAFVLKAALLPISRQHYISQSMAGKSLEDIAQMPDSVLSDDEFESLQVLNEVDDAYTVMATLIYEGVSEFRKTRKVTPRVPTEAQLAAVDKFFDLTILQPPHVNVSLQMDLIFALPFFAPGLSEGICEHELSDWWCD